jgi:hypothetical protein
MATVAYASMIGADLFAENQHGRVGRPPGFLDAHFDVGRMPCGCLEPLGDFNRRHCSSRLAIDCRTSGREDAIRFEARCSAFRVILDDPWLRVGREMQ